MHLTGIARLLLSFGLAFSGVVAFESVTAEQAGACSMTILDGREAARLHIESDRFTAEAEVVGISHRPLSGETVYDLSFTRIWRGEPTAEPQLRISYSVCGTSRYGVGESVMVTKSAHGSDYTTITADTTEARAVFFDELGRGITAAEDPGLFTSVNTRLVLPLPWLLVDPLTLVTTRGARLALIAWWALLVPGAIAWCSLRAARRDVTRTRKAKM